jgi:hypothetical protein
LTPFDPEDDLAADKLVQIGKDSRRVLRARIEAFNVFNHTEFSTIGTELTLSGAAGTDTNTNTQWGQYTTTLSPRQMSTTLRFEFQAFREHSAGLTPTPNWPTFIGFADRYFSARPAVEGGTMPLARR